MLYTANCGTPLMESTFMGGADWPVRNIGILFLRGSLVIITPPCLFDSDTAIVLVIVDRLFQDARML